KPRWGDVSRDPRVETRPLRILMVASEGPPTRSGIARTVKWLRDGLRKRGHDVDVISYPEVPRLILGEVRLSGLLLRLPSLSRCLSSYDIIHLHGATPTVSDLFLLLARIRRKLPPLVYTHHCDVEIRGLRPLSALYNAVHHRLTAVADHVVWTTSGYAGQAEACLSSSVIPLGIDLQRFLSDDPKDRTFTVLFVGQFRPYKGVPVLLKAMRQVAGGRLLVAGGGAQVAHYRDLAASLGVDVEFHVGPPDEELHQLYQRAHVVVLPSLTRAEAFGLVLLEGMAAGCVPVASDLPGVREVLGAVGHTFRPGDADALASMLRRLRDDPVLVAQMAARARDRAWAFSWERTVSEYGRLFLHLVAAREQQAEPVARDRTGTGPLLPPATQPATALEADSAQAVLHSTGYTPSQA
ncbi:MAG: glycosyltransferase family 4 protein, partial [Chloroflexota bacterium]|nr:glycosyltransferase family 4 protein [Chloroflexota bacterium]